MERTLYDNLATPSTAQSSSYVSRKRAPTDFSSRPTTGLNGTFDSPSSPQQQHHQRFVLSDPVAFSYLEEDRHTTVLERARLLEGYQLYVVEQWACSRTHPTFVIIAYTGDSSHTIKVGVLSVPADEESWSPRMRVYFKALAQYHARRKETPLGVLMVTNLSSFPSSLTIVHVPDGDLRKHREDFFVAENLKRLGCSGRVGLSIGEPSSATQAKFHQLYRISDKIGLYPSVIELIKLCQVSLNVFGCLGPEYADGLLCDITEAAINDWWTQLGSDLYNVEPSDGILGPTSVAALLGTLIGARNRLHVYGAPVTKDVFDIELTKRAIAHFQKTQRLRKTRRLDRLTLQRLHHVTAKQASGDGWAVPRAVKSTVAELSGRGGEMVMDMVGRAEKANIAEIETVDIERFAQLVKGERAQWLWHGKPRKRTTRDMFQDTGEDEVLKKRGEQHHSGKVADPKVTRADTFGDQQRSPVVSGPLEPVRQSTDGSRLDVDIGTKQGAFSRAKGRLRGVVVGKRAAHHHDDAKIMLNPSRDQSAESLDQLDTEPQSPSSLRKSADFDEPQQQSRNEASEDEPSTHGKTAESAAPDSGLIEATSTKEQLGEAINLRRSDQAPFPDPHTREDEERNARIDEEDETDNDASATETGLVTLLGRTQSLDRGTITSAGAGPAAGLGPGARQTQCPDAWFPRALSFSAAEDSVLPVPAQWPSDPPSPLRDSATGPTTQRGAAKSNAPAAALELERHRAATSKQHHALVSSLSSTVVFWVSSQVALVEHLDTLVSQDAEQLNHTFYPRKDEAHAQADAAKEAVQEGSNALTGAVRDAEAMGQRLEYEVGALRGKVEDVEAAVAEFERQVLYAEGRVKELVGSGSGGNPVPSGKAPAPAATDAADRLYTTPSTDESSDAKGDETGEGRDEKGENGIGWVTWAGRMVFGARYGQYGHTVSNP